MSKSKQKSKITPSQKRYNLRVPTTSFRLDPETVKKLNELREALNPKTWKNLFKILVGDFELKLKSIEEARKAGYELGFRNAKFCYGVSYPCPDCEQTIFINTPELKAKVRRLIAEAGWAHPECPILNLPKPTAPKPTPPSTSLPKPNSSIIPIEKSNNRDKILRFIEDNKNANDDKSLP